MDAALISLFVTVLIVAIVVFILKAIVDLLPIDAPFKRIAWLVLILLAVVVILRAALPLLTSALSI